MPAVILSEPNPQAGWKAGATSGAVPAGTAKMYVSLYGPPVVSGPDGYLDNLNLTLEGRVPEPGVGILASIGAATMGVVRWLRRRRDA